MTIESNKRLLGVATLVAAFAVGCSGSADKEPTNVSSSTGGVAGGGGEGGSGAGGGGGGAAGHGSTCGGLSGATCAADEYCEVGPSCGAPDGDGTCQPRPDCSNSGGYTVCGCDGKIYPFPCEANAAGVSTTDANQCTAPSGSFACGDRFCALSSQYCEVTHPGPGLKPKHDCKEKPAECGDAGTCECLSSVNPCGGMCEEGSDGALTLECPGGG
jgi:hypothetical protein